MKGETREKGKEKEKIKRQKEKERIRGIKKKNSPPIIFLTDYGISDEYVGVVKCVILSINPEAKILDLTHDVKPYDIYHAIFILEKSVDYFPDRSIILCVVDPGVGGRRKPILGEAILKNQKKIFFVCPDNGLITPIVEKAKRMKTFEIDVQKVLEKTKKYVKLRLSSTFHGRDIFAPASALISLGIKIKEIGKEKIEPQTLEIPKPSYQREKIRGNVIHIDRFGNIITNIEEKPLKEFLDQYQNKIKIAIKRRRKTKNKKDSDNEGEIAIPFVSSYEDVRKGKLLAIIGSYGTLEISLREDNAARKLHIERFNEIWVIK